MNILFSALTLLARQQKGIWPAKTIITDSSQLGMQPNLQ